MAHKIDNSKGFDAFISYGAAAWHGLGEVFDERISLQQAMLRGGLDFEVTKLPNIHALPIGLDPNGELQFDERISAESFFTYRTDVNKVLGAHVGKDYTVYQNAECFAVIDEILQKGTATIETAGSIDEGRKVFISLAVNDQIRVGGSDIVDQYVLITTSHDGTTSIIATPTNVRVVCNNTLTAALKGAKGAIRIRHSQNATARLEDAARVLKLMADNTKVNEDNYNTMRETLIDENKFFDYIGNLFYSKDEVAGLQHGVNKISTQKNNIVKDVIGFANKGTGQEEALFNGQLNMWHAYNAVTGYLARKKFKNANDRARNMMFGAGADLIQKAGVLAMSPADIEPCRRVIGPGFAGMSLN